MIRIPFAEWLANCSLLTKVGEIIELHNQSFSHWLCGTGNSKQILVILFHNQIS